MPIREVKPFDEKQWSELVCDAKNGQTLEQAEQLAKAGERARKVNF